MRHIVDQILAEKIRQRVYRAATTAPPQSRRSHEAAPNVELPSSMSIIIPLHFVRYLSRRDAARCGNLERVIRSKVGSHKDLVGGS